MKHRALQISILLFFTPFFAGAAELYLEVTPSVAKVGDIVKATLYLDPQGEIINAIEGSLSYAPEFTVSQVRDGDSLVTFWVQKPDVRGDSIFFAGIVPGGYRGDVSPKWQGYAPGKVLTVSFVAKQPGNAWVQINRDTVVLLHDGKGTEAPLTVRDATVSVQGEEGDIPADTETDWNDGTPPEVFTPLVVRQHRSFFGDDYTVIFETADKQSGIDHYEIKEGDKDFVVAESPYTLTRQERDVPIVIRAIDRAGNVQTVSIPPSFEQAGYEKILTNGLLREALLFMAACAIVGAYILYVRRKK